jgi:hypothetical protein
MQVLFCRLVAFCAAITQSGAGMDTCMVAATCMAATVDGMAFSIPEEGATLTTIAASVAAAPLEVRSTALVASGIAHRN